MTVTTLHIELFGGFISVDGYSSTAQRWVVFVAGGVAVSLLGLSMVILGMMLRTARPAIRQFLILGGVAQIVGHLIVLPLLSVGRTSDWSVIYDFSTNRTLSWAASAAHSFGLFALWCWWMTRLRWTLRAMVAGVEDDHRRWIGALHLGSGGDLDARLRLATSWMKLGHLRLAHRLLEEANDNRPEVQLARSRLAMFQRRWEGALAATALGLQTPKLESSVWQGLIANQALALVNLDRHTEAVAAFAELEAPLASDRWVAYWRGLARTATGDLAGGNSDLRSVADALPRGTLLRSHIEAQLQGRRSTWRGFLMALAGRLFRDKWLFASEWGEQADLEAGVPLNLESSGIATEGRDDERGDR